VYRRAELRCPGPARRSEPPACGTSRAPRAGRHARPLRTTSRSAGRDGCFAMNGAVRGQVRQPPSHCRGGRIRAAAATRRRRAHRCSFDKRASPLAPSSRPLGTSSESLEAPGARACFGGNDRRPATGPGPGAQTSTPWFLGPLCTEARCTVAIGASLMTSAGPAPTYGATLGYRECLAVQEFLADGEPGTPGARSRVAR
jgi:hypothetical protein